MGIGLSLISLSAPQLPSVRIFGKRTMRTEKRTSSQSCKSRSKSVMKRSIG